MKSIATKNSLSRQDPSVAPAHVIYRAQNPGRAHIGACSSSTVVTPIFMSQHKVVPLSRHQRLCHDTKKNLYCPAPCCDTKVSIATQSEPPLSQQGVLCRDRALKEEACHDKPSQARLRARTGPRSCTYALCRA